MSVFSEFVAASSIAPAVIAEYADRVPEEITELWTTFGSGLIGSGILRLIDPSVVEPWLPTFVDDPEGCVPVFASAYADIVVWRDRHFFSLDTRLRAAHALWVSSPRHLLRFIEDPHVVEHDYRVQTYEAATARLGVPTIDECFYYVPLLSMGGPAEAGALRRGGIAAHLAVAADLQGKIQIGPDGGTAAS